MDRRRAAFIVTAALVATAGCASVLGLEDRHLEGGGVPESGVDAPGSDVQQPNSDSAADTAVRPAGPCNPPGALVYEFDTDVGGKGYLTDAAALGARNPRARFYLLSPSYPLEGSSIFFAQMNAQGDYLVSFHDAGEDDGAYGVVEQLPNMFAIDAGLQVPTETVPLLRYYQVDASVAHRFFREAESKDGWNSDNHTWYACPLP